MFRPGESGNRKGRPRGSKNKSPQKVKRFVERLLAEKSVMKEVRREFLDMNGKEFLKAYTDLLKFVIPTQSAGSLDVDLNKLSDEQVDELYNKVMQGINNNA